MADEQQTNNELTPKQALFVQEYIVDYNGSAAARRAGYSVDTAKEIASENLTKPNIAAAIKEAEQSRNLRMGLSQERVIKELMRIGFADIRQLYDENSVLMPIRDLSDDIAAALVGVDVDEILATNIDGEKEVIGNTKKVKLADKMKALQELGVYTGKPAAKTDVTSNGKELKAQTEITVDFSKSF